MSQHKKEPEEDTGATLDLPKKRAPAGAGVDSPAAWDCRGGGAYDFCETAIGLRNRLLSASIERAHPCS